MMQDTMRVTKSRVAYISLAMVELLQKPEHKLQPAEQAAEVKQQAKLLKLNTPPISDEFLKSNVLFSKVSSSITSHLSLFLNDQ